MAVSREDGSVRTGVLPPFAEVEDSGMVLVVVANLGAWPILAPDSFSATPSTHQAAMHASPKCPTLAKYCQKQLHGVALLFDLLQG